MADYRAHMSMLVMVLIAHLFLFLVISMLRWEDFARVVFVSAMVTLLAILILARFGGGLASAE